LDIASGSLIAAATIATSFSLGDKPIPIETPAIPERACKQVLEQTSVKPSAAKAAKLLFSTASFAVLAAIIAPSELSDKLPPAIPAATWLKEDTVRFSSSLSFSGDLS
jgi:hypothetical protein